MKIVNRGYISIKAKETFVNWATKQDEDLNFIGAQESNVYLVEEDFFEDEPVLKSNFKSIFINELASVTDDESSYPEINFENFEEWFSYELGNTVMDCENTGLNAN